MRYVVARTHTGRGTFWGLGYEQTCPQSINLIVCLSVCLSVTSGCSTKTAKHRITQTNSAIARAI